MSSYLPSRLDEHIDKKDPKSVVCLHMTENRGHVFNWGDTQILDLEFLEF